MENSSFYFDLQEIVSAFMVLFAVIDVTGLLPVFIDFQNKGMKISPIKAAIYSLIAFVAFLFVGNGILQLFQVDISSFGRRRFFGDICDGCGDGVGNRNFP